MKSVNIHDAKTHFSKLVDEASKGQQIVIAKAGKPQAMLVPIKSTSVKRRKGLMKGKIKISDDFDQALPDDILKQFYQ